MAETETETATGTDERAYRGLFGAFPYAFRRSDSRLFRAYVAVGGLAALVLGVGFGLAFVVSVAQSTGLATGGTDSFVRTFVLFVGFLVVLPVLGPVLLVARHHRRTGADLRYDRALATVGFVYLASLYLTVVASMPPAFVLDGETVTRPAPAGLFAPVIALLYAVPAVAAPFIPVAVAAVGWLVHRRLR
jgi:hypothetical protein